MSLYQAGKRLASPVRQISGVCAESVAISVVSLSQVWAQVCRKFDPKLCLKLIDELVGCPLRANQLFVQHSLKITLQAATVDLWAERLEVLDGQLPARLRPSTTFRLGQA